MRILDTRRDFRDDKVRVSDGYYPLHGFDLDIREVMNIIYEKGTRDFNDFVKNRDAYVLEYVQKLEEKKYGNNNR